MRGLAQRRWLVGLVTGALFAVGLALSGMTDPGRVLGFLDVTGRWDPSLLWVMAGAIGFHFTALRLAKTPVEPAVQNRWVDRRLLLGASLFGVGWGFSGYCPGPALVGAAFGRVESLLFLGAMLLGMNLFHVVERRARGDLDQPWTHPAP